jgi:dihydropteroate synthase
MNMEVLSENSMLEIPRTFIQCNGKLLDLNIPVVMGIINVTPDSFFKGSRFTTEEKILERASEIIAEGGKIIDIGAISTRPGARMIDLVEEWARLESALQIIRKKLPDEIISVDTFRSEIVRRAFSTYQIGMVNDISAGLMDKNMFKTVAELKLAYVMMHIQGIPSTMQQNPVYQDVTKEIIKFFSERIELLKLSGVNDCIIDPGFGFGKTLEHNYELLTKLDWFNLFNRPVLVGLSRKSMIYKFLGVESETALNGTSILHTIALQKGAKILRVHDVREAVQVIKLVNKLMKTEV